MNKDNGSIYDSSIETHVARPDAVHYKQDSLFCARFNGFDMFAPIALSSFYKEGAFEPFSSSLVLNSIQDGAVFLDIGSHVGYYSLLASKKIGNGKIFAFEPVKENREIIDMNIKANGFYNITVIGAAVCASVGQRNFTVMEDSACSGFSEHPHSRVLYKQLIPTCTIDAFLKEQGIRASSLCAVKIDTEGNEESVLKGMRETLAQNPDIRLCIEFNPPCLIANGTDPVGFLTLLTELGLDIYAINEKQRTVSRIAPQFFPYWNIFFIDRDYLNVFCVARERKNDSYFLQNKPAQAIDRTDEKRFCKNLFESMRTADKELVIQKTGKIICELENYISMVSAERDMVIAERNAVSAERDILLADKDATIAEKDRQNNLLLNSKSWKITAPFRFCLSLAKKLFSSKFFLMPSVIETPSTISPQTEIKKKKKRIVFIVPALIIGGAERIAYEILSRLHSDFDFFFITTAPFDNVWHEKFARYSIGIYHLPHALEYCYWRRFVLDFVRHNAIDSVCVYNCAFGYETLESIKNVFPRVKTFCIITEESVFGLNSFVRAYGQFIDICVAMNETIRTSAIHDLQIPKEKVVCIRNGVDMSGVRESSDTMIKNKKRIVWMGRFYEEKRPFDFIDIACRFLERNDFFFCMYGDGPLKHEALKKSLSLPNIDIIPAVDDVSRVFQEAYALILTSKTEVTPLIILEALAMNVPVITTPVGETEYMIVSGKNGFIIPVGDIDAMVCALDSVGHIQRAGLASYVSAEFSIHSMIKKYKEIFSA